MLPTLIPFVKYHGTGNDFILIDNREEQFDFSREDVARFCRRRFGIGADGLMLLQKSDKAAFRMVYYNADGGESTLCGNGSRCIVAFAKKLNILTEDSVLFEAVDGLHEARLLSDGTIALHMNDVATISTDANGVFLDTGSPHYIIWTDDIEAEDVHQKGTSVRNSARFVPGGTNVNFVQRNADGSLHVRTFERGVEAETWSCGTGVTAAAIASTDSTTGHFRKTIHTPGGDLEVSFQKTGPTGAENICLIGPARFVFEGKVSSQDSHPYFPETLT